ncbi:hypothetical protein [Leifsonia sp. fls2-241-R2A-40a]|uniref:hypothetical protein n=1 Tax=Leifsonia sp. fls2-241-R2A-40a TaxID=3040290 RepID=UPI00254A5ECC|nr:hypothetical protein [Leifsonia sp. fls2-241-R2A-40a]
MHTTSYNHAHDKAQLLARRHERDLHWAKERRRQHERESAEARAVLAARPLRLARSALWSGGSLLAVTAAAWAVALTVVEPSWSAVVDGAGALVVLAVVVAVGVALGRIRARRAAARALLHSRGDRLSHTQYHIHESVHSFIDARVDVVNTRTSIPA